MADGALTLILDDATVARLAEAAALAGQTPEAYAADRLAETLSPPLAHDWTEANERLAERGAVEARCVAAGEAATHVRRQREVVGERALPMFVAVLLDVLRRTEQSL